MHRYEIRHMDGELPLLNSDSYKHSDPYTDLNTHANAYSWQPNAHTNSDAFPPSGRAMVWDN